jgi:phosphomannomutase
MSKLFLFDMDGTLTPARKKMNFEMLSALEKLQRSGWEIGIISGSDYEYIEQQCDLLFDLSPIDVTKIHFLPCNGTKYYKSFKKVWEYDMRSKLGSEFMNKLYKTLLGWQNNIVSMYPTIPLTGNFFQMRGSVLNWCPIGRNALNIDREKWIELDKKQLIREIFITHFNSKYNSDSITIKLGGETSFDIYPKGWNKTFSLDKQPFTEYEKIYFAGDRCHKNGNDEELYNFLKKEKFCNAFQVNKPEDTIELIQKVIQEKK